MVDETFNANQSRRKGIIYYDTQSSNINDQLLDFVLTCQKLKAQDQQQILIEDNTSSLGERRLSPCKLDFLNETIDRKDLVYTQPASKLGLRTYDSPSRYSVGNASAPRQPSKERKSLLLQQQHSVHSNNNMQTPDRQHQILLDKIKKIRDNFLQPQKIIMSDTRTSDIM